MNSRFPILLCSLISVVYTFSLLDRVHSRNDVRSSIPDFRTSDADVGMRSAHFIGSFRGQPIKTRQHHAFIDDNGVPIPLLPFVDKYSAEADVHPQRRQHEKQMARERKIYKWAHEMGGIVRRQ